MTPPHDRIVPVTVLLPVHNGGPHLPVAVDSILRQTHRELELLAIDDGSTDGSGEYLDALTDPRVRVHHQANLGLVAALNTGLEMARFELVARMDADDVSAPDRLEQQVRYLLEHPDVAAVGCCYDVIDEHDHVVDVVHTAANPTYLARQLYFRNVLAHAGMMFRRDFVITAGGYRDVGPVEDYDLWMRLTDRHQIASLPDRLLAYRRTPTGISMQAHERQRRYHKRAQAARHVAHPIVVPSATVVWREGMSHSRAYSPTCRTATRNYVFDHAWLAILLARRGRLRDAARLAAGVIVLVACRPAGAGGLLDILRSR